MTTSREIHVISVQFMQERSEATYALLALLNASLNFGNMALRIFVERIGELGFAEDGQALLDRQLALPEALPSAASRHPRLASRRHEIRSNESPFDDFCCSDSEK